MEVSQNMEKNECIEFMVALITQAKSQMDSVQQLEKGCPSAAFRMSNTDVMSQHRKMLVIQS